MKTIQHIFFLTISLLMFTSCEDVIELDLETTENQLVIEATLDASQQLATVSISQSNDFYDNSDLERISGASIFLQNENGTTYTLEEISAGTYRAENVESNPGDQFTIQVGLEDQSYEASSQVPSSVDLKEIEITEDAIELPFDDDEGSIALSVSWDDPAGIENYYRVRSYVDNIYQADFYTILKDDFIGDGDEISLPLRDRFEENTTVSLELLSTDENYYDYFFQVSSVAGDGAASTTPYNPEGNFSPKVLGYFGIYYSSTLSIEL